MTRGRPRSLSPEMLEGMTGIFSKVRTNRGMQNKALMCNAATVLGDDPQFAWLKPSPHVWRETILAELGRIGDETAIRKAAEYLCELKPSTNKAIALIRSWRKVQRPGNAVALANVIAGAIDRYRCAHQDIRWQDVRAVLERILENVSEIQEEGRE